MSILTAFTTQLINLTSNLCEMYPDDPDLRFTQSSVEFMKKSNPRKLQKIFDQHVSKYAAQILKRDERFLLTTDFLQEERNKTKNKKDDIEYAESIMNNLRKYWSTMDVESKTNLWKYLQVLILLNTKCNA